MPNFISEEQIEKAIIRILTDTLGYRHMDCYTVDPGNLDDGSGRMDKSEVVLVDVLREKAKSLNRKIPEAAVDQAIGVLIDRRYAMSRMLANKEVYHLIRDGIPVTYENGEGRTEHGLVRVIDFLHPLQNDFLAVSQLWIKGERYYRRPDILLYVNGIPLVFIELKNSNVKLKNAYLDNLTNYKKDIPLLFQYNSVCILSNAVESRVGSFTAGWEFFFNWLRVEDETEKIDRRQIEKEGTSAERIIRGLCPKDRLLDYVENFILFYNDEKKIIAQNQQFIGTNRVIAAFEKRKQNQGKLGVFWHTQGAGKSFSMIFLVRKVFRKFTGNFTFVVITDRDDLDGQIYRNFLHTGTVSRDEAARPKNSKAMREFLSRNLRVVFTLIQKFRWDKGKDYPVLSDRPDIIVIVDEAHRTQYKDLAENMRKGLPCAQYLAFTGTPLLGSGRKTNAWFGNYVSEYNFSQSMDDGATVPLFYQKRVPEVLIHNEDLDEEFYRILEEENLTDNQQEKLEKSFAAEVEVIKRDDRLDTIAQDIVYHFPRRGYLGKGMVISVDKFTAVKMHDKVQTLWKQAIKDLVGQIGKTQNQVEKHRLKKIRDFMRNVEMAVVISLEGGKDEEKKFSDQGLDIIPHRTKINSIDANGHDLEYRFKDPHDPFQMVFVCAMWLTGFDAPTVSTLYLDKPMKGHTLMQTIARANRVTSHKICGREKMNGEIIDYYNVFRNMKSALSDYALGSEGRPEEMPVRDKSNLFDLLDDALSQGIAFSRTLEIDLEKVLAAKEVFKKIQWFTDFSDRILEKDEWKKEFYVYENAITGLYEACKPEILGDNSRPLVFVFQYLRGVIESIIQGEDIESARQKISELLDQSVVTNNRQSERVAESQDQYHAIQPGKVWDLQQTDFQRLKEQFPDKPHKHIEITDLRSFLEKKLEQMLQQNTTRIIFSQRYQQIVDRYNSGNSAADRFYADLTDFAESLKAEEERHIREGLTEDELELFDILKKEKMTKKEEQRVKLASRQLLHRLLEEHPRVLIQDWYKDSQSQARVLAAVEEVLDKSLPGTYPKEMFQEKCSHIYNLIFEYASKGEKWAV
ncbi:MAG: HsdR family type I site-specific deoxyribonuclease [Pseudomonadota bacterium]